MAGFAALLRELAHPIGRLGEAVQRRLGHASAKTTLDIYGHLWPDDEDRTRAAVDAELGTALEAPAASPRPEAVI